MSVKSLAPGKRDRTSSRLSSTLSLRPSPKSPKRLSERYCESGDQNLLRLDVARSYRSFNDSLHVAAGTLPEALRSKFALAVAEQLADIESRRQEQQYNRDVGDEADSEMQIAEREEEDIMLDEMAQAIDRVGGMEAALQKIAALRAL